MRLLSKTLLLLKLALSTPAAVLLLGSAPAAESNRAGAACSC
jgi:hypothetical protein